VGFWSTDDEEDNDSDYNQDEDNEGEDEEEYDEEDEDDEEAKDEDRQQSDPTEMIQTEKYEKSLHPEEKKYLMQVSEVEKRIMNKEGQFFDKRRKICYKESDFKWWSYDNKDTSFVLTTKRKSTY